MSVFKVAETTISAYHEALLSRKTTCRAVVCQYLERCKTLDPTLHSLIRINERAVAIAEEYDTFLGSATRNTPLPLLFGVPIILKDSFSTHDMPTSAGCKSLATYQTLKGVSISSLGGQCLNPYDLTRTPGGSSGGTAAAISANLGMVGCGGDTMNSIRSPASACSLVGFRPSAGHICCSGVVPVAPSQDALGPITRTIEDAKRLFECMADTPLPCNMHKPLNDIRVGTLENYFVPDSGETRESAIVAAVVRRAFNAMKLQGVTFKYITEDEFNIECLHKTLDVQRFEFQEAFDSHFREYTSSVEPFAGSPPNLEMIRNLDEYDHIAVPQSSVFYQALLKQNNTSNPEYLSRLQGLVQLKRALKKIFVEHSLDILAFPHQRQLVVKTGYETQPNRNGLLAALTGHPSLCIPAGFAESMDALIGVPIGLELVGEKDNDYMLLHIGGLFEAIIQGRREPLI